MNIPILDGSTDYRRSVERYECRHQAAFLLG